MRTLRKRCHGVTLVEMLFVGLLIPLIFCAMYVLLRTSTTSYRTNDVQSQLNHHAMQVLRTITRELAQTSPSVDEAHCTLRDDADGNSILTFQIPVDWDNDGDAVDDSAFSMDAEWGAYETPGDVQDGMLDSWIRYSLEEGQLIREVLDSGQNPIEGLRQVIANHVESFTAVQNLNVVTLTIAMSVVDQTAGTGRTFTVTLNHDTVLRNEIE